MHIQILNESTLKKEEYEHCEKNNPGSCSFTYNFDKEYKDNFIEKYNDELSDLELSFTEFSESNGEATFEIIESREMGEISIEVKSTGHIQNKTRTVSQEIEINTIIGNSNPNDKKDNDNNNNDDQNNGGENNNPIQPPTQTNKSASLLQTDLKKSHIPEYNY